MIGIGDAGASLIGPQLYDEFVWPYEKKLIEGVHALGAKVRLHICGNTRPHLERKGALQSEIVDLDYLAPVAEGRQKMEPNQVLSGNVNPVRVLRNGTPEAVIQAISDCHRQAGPKFIVGAGCEIPRDTPAANLRALCEYAHNHKP